MSKLITERDVLELIKKNSDILVIPKGCVITPLALDRIKISGLRVQYEDPALNEDVFSPVHKNKLFPSLAVGSDHTGYKMKIEVSNLIKTHGVTLADVGCYNEESCDYPDYTAAVCAKILKNEATGGILFDATGIPSAITANKFTGIRAATCYNEFSALSARSHNNANVLVLGARTLGIETVKTIIDRFLTTPFDGGRHQKRLDKISRIEEIRK